MWFSRRNVGLALAAGAGVALLWVLLRPTPVPVEAAAVSRGPLQVTVDEEGETRVRERYVVAAPTSGRLLRITLEEGDAVAAGTLLARLEPAPLDPRTEAGARAHLEAAQANQRAAGARVRLAAAGLAQARRDARRAERLREAGTLSAEAYELAQLEETRLARELEAARFAAKAADYEVEVARAALLTAGGPGTGNSGGGTPCEGSVACVDLHSPVAGRVLRIPERSERVVVAGAPLLELGDPGALEIVVDVLSADAVRVQPGAPIWIEDWGGDAPLAARVRRVEPSGFTKISALGVEEQRVNVIADFAEAVPALGDGYRVEARIVVWEGADVLQVPGSALFRRGDAWHVFVLEAGRARLRRVEVGRRATFETEIRDGLEPGETVILHPSDRVADGVRVAPL